MRHDQTGGTGRTSHGESTRRPSHRGVSSFVNGYAVLIITLSLAALGLSLWSLVTGQSVWPDHEVYRRAVHGWLSGREIMPQVGVITNTGELPWVYPPFALLPLLPFALLPLKVDITVMFVLNTAALTTTLYLVTRHVWRSLSKAGVLAVALVGTRLALFLEPVAGCFHQGQINILLMGLVAADCLTYRPRWPRGTLVGLAAAIKLMPLAFLLLFLARKDLRAAATTCVVAAVATTFGIVIAPEASMKYWILQGPAASAFGSPLRSNQSILAVLVRWGLPPVVQAGLWILLCLVVTAAAWGALRKLDIATAVTINGILALLVSPTSWSNHWVWIVPGLLLMFGYGFGLQHIGWLIPASITTIVTIAAPFAVLSRDRAEMFSLDWAGHLQGSSYVLLGAALIILAWFRAQYESNRINQLPP